MAIHFILMSSQKKINFTFLQKLYIRGEKLSLLLLEIKNLKYKKFFVKVLFS